MLKLLSRVAGDPHRPARRPGSRREDAHVSLDRSASRSHESTVDLGDSRFEIHFQSVFRLTGARIPVPTGKKGLVSGDFGVGCWIPPIFCAREPVPNPLRVATARDPPLSPTPGISRRDPLSWLAFSSCPIRRFPRRVVSPSVAAQSARISRVPPRSGVGDGH